MSDLTALPPLPPTWLLEAHSAREDYFAAIHDAITNHPRSLQTRIGPSEIGQKCSRRLAYKLAGKPEGEERPNWRATVGTACHMWQEETFDRANLTFLADHDNVGVERWLIEETVTVGHDAAGEPITGHCDLFDRLTGTVIDHKFVGRTQLSKYKAQGPSQQYRYQAHLYGQGWVNAGFAIRDVAICFLPRDGDLADAHWWTEPFDPAVAAEALQRLHGIQLAVSALGDAAFAALGTADDYCQSCPFHVTGSTDLSTGCPGDTAAITRIDAAQTNQLAGLLPASA